MGEKTTAVLTRGQIWKVKLPGWDRVIRVGVVDIDPPVVALARPANGPTDRVFEVVEYLAADVMWIKEVPYATT